MNNNEQQFTQPQQPFTQQPEQPFAQPQQQQFAQPQQQPFTQPQQQPFTQPQQQQFAQPQQQQFAQPQQQQFAQPQQQSFAQQQFAQFQNFTLTADQNQLNKSWLLGLIGMGVVALGFLIGTIAFFSAVNSNAISSYAFKTSGAESTSILMTIFQFCIVAVFFFLVFMLKNAKTKTLPIVLIVFSSIFLFTSLFGFLTPVLGVQLAAFISAGGWACVLTSGVFATQAFK